jgi:predicted nucleotidyltransferase
VAAYESGARQPTISTLDRLLAACDHELILDIRRATVRSRPTLALVRRHRRRLLDSAARHGARNVRIFGSVASDATSAESDVDLLVDLDRERTLVDLAALRADASMILGLPVDIATADLLKPHVRADVLDHAVALRAAASAIGFTTSSRRSTRFMRTRPPPMTRRPTPLATRSSTGWS